jgi:hypothetical protein
MQLAHDLRGASPHGLERGPAVVSSGELLDVGSPRPRDFMTGDVGLE